MRAAAHAPPLESTSSGSFAPGIRTSGPAPGRLSAPGRWRTFARGKQDGRDRGGVPSRHPVLR